VSLIRIKLLWPLGGGRGAGLPSGGRVTISQSINQ